MDVGRRVKAAGLVEVGQGLEEAMQRPPNSTPSLGCVGGAIGLAGLQHAHDRRGGWAAGCAEYRRFASRGRRENGRWFLIMLIAAVLFVTLMSLRLACSPGGSIRIGQGTAFNFFGYPVWALFSATIGFLLTAGICFKSPRPY